MLTRRHLASPNARDVVHFHCQCAVSLLLKTRCWKKAESRSYRVCSATTRKIAQYSNTADYEVQESRKTGVVGESLHSSASNGLDGLSQGLHGKCHERECASAQRQAAQAEMPLGLAPKNVRHAVVCRWWEEPGWWLTVRLIQ
jgi:hypothetical protein